MTEFSEGVEIDDFDKRVQKALEVGFVMDLVQWAKTGDDTNLTHIKDNSRSGLEYHLTRQGWFWVGEGGTETVRKWMNQFNPPKWAEEGPGSDYQRLTIENSYQKARYNPIPKSSDYNISRESIRAVMSVLVQFNRVQNAKIREQTGLSETTVMRGLNYLIEKGVVIHKKDGRSNYYQDIGVASVDDHQIQKDLNPKEAQLEWCRRYYNNII